MRVIAGRLGGREIRAPKGRATRPTSDRVREALFSVLGDLEGAVVLDLYAGSGALGIEALSRGARHTTFVESNPAAAKTIEENMARLGLDSEARLIRATVERSARALAEGAPYDLVLCDPPWTDLSRAARSVGRVLVPGLLSAGARVVLEHPSREQLALGDRLDLALTTCRTWGDTSVSIFQLQSGDGVE